VVFWGPGPIWEPSRFGSRKQCQKMSGSGLDFCSFSGRFGTLRCLCEGVFLCVFGSAPFAHFHRFCGPGVAKKQRFFGDHFDAILVADTTCENDVLPGRQLKFEGLGGSGDHYFLKGFVEGVKSVLLEGAFMDFSNFWVPSGSKWWSILPKKHIFWSPKKKSKTRTKSYQLIWGRRRRQGAQQCC